MLEVKEVSLGNVSRLYQYKQRKTFSAHFSLKGFEYPWLIESREWKPLERVLDVGAAYSRLPMHLQETYGCEVWVVDDFGTKSNEPFWLRGQSPQQHIENNPNVRFVLERLGDPENSSLPARYFDVVYSLSVLEHVPCAIIRNVWRHMEKLLRPGGELIHAIDIPFASNRGWQKVLAGEIFDCIYNLVPSSFKLRYCMATPKNYIRLVFDALGIRQGPGKNLALINMVLDPDILTEAYSTGLNRILKDGMTDFRYSRVGALLLHLKKTDG